LLLIRLSDRAGKGIRAAPRDALIVDSTEPDSRGRAFGYQRSMDHLGAALGPVLATIFLLAYPGQLRWLFALTLLPGIVVVMCVVFGLREAPPSPPASESKGDKTAPPPPNPPAAETGVLLSLRGFDSHFRRTLLAVFLFTLGNSTDAFLLVRAEEVGVKVVWLPMLWCVFNLLKSSLSALVGGAIDRYGAKRLLLAGWLVYMGAYLGFAYATELWHILTLFVVYAVFYALAEPSERALVASLCDAGQRGLAFGWFNSAIGIAALPASLLFGYLYEQFGPLAAFGFGSAMALGAALILVFVKAPLHTQGTDRVPAELPT
jgi:MFS family permease